MYILSYMYILKLVICVCACVFLVVCIWRTEGVSMCMHVHLQEDLKLFCIHSVMW